jgi:hypothetical protein
MENPYIYSILLKQSLKYIQKKCLKILVLSAFSCLIRIRQNEVKNNFEFQYLSVSKYKY